jgi:hypothetical protein
MKWLGAANPRAGSGVSLHDRVRTDLEQGFKGALPDYPLGPSEADLLIHQGSRMAVIEVKTGNPELPLPSSTSAQMLLLKQRVREKFPELDGEEVLPVLVTNYKVSSTDQKELEDQGIKVVWIDPSVSSSSDPRNFSLRVANLTGLKTDPELV